MCSKRIPASLLKNIKKCYKQEEKLRKALGYKYKKFSLSEKDIFEIEVKLTPEEYKNLKKNEEFNLEKVSLLDRELAYFYRDTSDKDIFRFGAGKILNGELKEYYERILPFHIKEGDSLTKKFVKYHTFSGEGQSLIFNIDLFFNKNCLYTGFYCNDVFFRPSYVSIDAKTNLVNDVYFYGESETNFFQDIKGTKEIIRVDISTLKVNKIYSYLSSVEGKDGNFEFFYYNPNNINEYNTILKTIFLN